MNTKSPNRTLKVDIILFIFFGILIWIINITGQSSFPGNNMFPFIMRSLILLFGLILSYFLNYRFSRKNKLTFKTLNFKSENIKYCLVGIVLGCLLIATIWAIIYLIYPFEIIKNSYSKINPVADIISYSLGNTLEELLFRGFILVASVKLIGKVGGVLFVSLLFGLFHLQGTGLNVEGLNMVLTTFTMSLLFISVIYYTASIWTAATLHITGNLLLHTFGFEGANNGLFNIRFSASNVDGHITILIYEIVVIAFALIIFRKGKKQL